MNTIDVSSIVQVYEVDGAEIKGLKSDKPNIIIRNHWNRRELVELEVGGQRLTVSASDLERAIANAQNAHRY